MAKTKNNMDEQNIVSVFNNLLPDLIKIKKDKSLDREDKVKAANDLIISRICKARVKDENDTTGISSKYISKVCVIVNSKDNIDGIIYYINCIINKKKDSEEETND